MIPVPEYLVRNARNAKGSESRIQFSFICRCGCDRFIPFQNSLSPEERRAMKPYCDAVIDSVTGCLASACTRDEDGTLHHWKLYSDDGLNGPKEEVFIPEAPFFAGISVVKLRCCRCEEEHFIFDNRRHGYDGVTGVHTQEALDYSPRFRKKSNTPVGIEIKVENDPSLEEFRENTGLAYDELRYSNAFSRIKIYALSDNGKRRPIFECETA